MNGGSDDRDRGGVAVARGCPSADALSAFASGEISEHDLVTIADHVSQCDTCEAAVRGLSGKEDSLAGRLRAAVQHAAPVEDPACLRMQEAAKAIRPRRDEAEVTETELDAGSAESNAPAERQVTATVTWSPTLPATIGRYQVRSELGRGGFGSVYLAHDPDLDRPVAIKVPRFDADVSDERIRWFLHEARTAARLKHPGIVAVYEVGRQDNSCHIVMEYVEGRSLSAVMAKGKLPLARIVQIVRDAATAAHYAHKKGLVHRDLKPGNILLDADGQVKIADFGLALHEDQQRSRAGELAGTLGYMSPEQVRRDVHRLDGRSDIWALGVILYELLTGKRPFQGTQEQMADEILHRSPKPLRQIRDDIDPVLEAICLKCLAKDPEQRYSSCQDLAAALNRWQQREPQSAPRRSRVALWAAAAVALVGIGAAAMVLPNLNREPDGPYQVDLVAKPFVPLDLLSGPPEQIFPKDEPDQHWERLEGPPRIHMECNTSVFLALGTTRSDNYKLRVEASKVAPVGFSSLFFGFQELPAVNGFRRWRCQALSIHRNAGWPPYVLREVLSVKELWSGSLSLDRKYLDDVRVPDLALKDVPLEVEIKGGRVVTVRAGGRSYPELADPLVGELDLPTQGRFGLVNARGSTIFHDARFESLQPAPPR